MPYLLFFFVVIWKKKSQDKNHNWVGIRKRCSHVFLFNLIDKAVLFWSALTVPTTANKIDDMRTIRQVILYGLKYFSWLSMFSMESLKVPHAYFFVQVAVFIE